MGSDLETRIRHVTAVLGPTNTGKTHSPSSACSATRAA